MKTLKMGIDAPAKTPQQKENILKELRDTVEHYIPEFAKACKTLGDARKKAGEEEHKPMLTLCQDAFAAGHDDDEYLLFGMALKYANLHDLEVTILPGPCPTD